MGFLRLFGFNIFSYQVALFIIWLTTFIFTLLLVDMFLNIWLFTANLFVAYGLWWLWKLRTALILGPVIATALTASIVAGGVIDLLPIYNSSRVEINYDREPLVKRLAYRTSVIYKLPEPSPAAVLAREDLSKPPVTAFQGGHGRRKGEFDNPRAVAFDSAGNIYVADTNNRRVQKFSPNGTFVTQIGPFEAPNGIAIDRAGNIYVAEVGSKHRIQKVGPDGSFIAVWAPALYGPRKIAIGPDDSVYVADQGNTRIVKFSPDGQLLAVWGSKGTDGQFDDPTSVAIDPTTDKVYVADPRNKRIQVFDSNGKFLTKWSVPGWDSQLASKIYHRFTEKAVCTRRARI